MKNTFLKNLFLFCMILLTLSCDNEQDNYTSEEAIILEENNSDKISNDNEMVYENKSRNNLEGNKRRSRRRNKNSRPYGY